jgi:hypothetical protein
MELRRYESHNSEAKAGDFAPNTAQAARQRGSGDSQISERFEIWIGRE